MSSTSIPPALPLPLSSSPEARPTSRRWPQRLGRAVAILGIALAALAFVLYGLSWRRQHTVFTAARSDFAIPTDAASIAEGERLFHARGCAECHGEDAGGRVMIDDPALGRLVSANLTYFASASPQSWSQAVRDGLRASGEPLMLMPAGELNPMPDRELGAIVAYVRSLPRVVHELPPLALGPVGRSIDLAGLLPLMPAHDIDHRARPAEIPTGRTPEMGAYLGRMCTNCHGAHLSGGPVPGAPPEMGIPANITFDETGLAGWSEEDFRRVLREGQTPDGRQIDPAQMPWRTFLSHLSDDEIGALYDYLQTVPHRHAGER